MIRADATITADSLKTADGWSGLLTADAIITCDALNYTADGAYIEDEEVTVNSGGGKAPKPRPFRPSMPVALPPRRNENDEALCLILF